jgi:hypothetical protein
MSLWDSFRSTLGVGLKKATGGGSYLNPEEQKKNKNLPQQLEVLLMALIEKLNLWVP